MKVYLFDIDGTLIRCGGAGGAAMRRALSERLGLAEGFDLPLAGRTDRAIVSDAIRGAGHDPADHFEAVCARYVPTLGEELRARDGYVLPGVADLLRTLIDSGEALVGLLTGNLRRGAESKLGHFGLGGFFDWDAAAFGDDHPDRDDVARDAFRNAESRLPAGRLDPSAVVVIGDTPRDVRCARAIGATAIAVATGDFGEAELAACEPDHVLPDLSGGLPNV